MEQGSLVEFIDRQKIMCAVVLEVKNHRLRLLTETNREVTMSTGRLAHVNKECLDLSIGRDKLVETLKKTALRRHSLTRQIDIKELWEVLNTEQEWIDLGTMTEFCFPNNPTGDHESAVIRAFFENKTYFKFNADRFFPYTQDQVENIIAQADAVEKRNRIIETGGDWLHWAMNADSQTCQTDVYKQPAEFIEILKSVYLFGKEHPYYPLGKSILTRAGITNDDALFHVLVKLGVMDKNENIELLRNRIPVAFSENILLKATGIVTAFKENTLGETRRDLTDLHLITIDGQATLDFDDAVSIEDAGDHYRLGIHIADVAHFIPKGDRIDQEAMSRGSSIYMPDQKISMLPPCLAEDLCSLKQGKLRPAISIMANITPSAHVIDYEIFPSVIQVKAQLTYYEVNMMAEEDPNLKRLYDIGKKFRQYRLQEGALQISLPDVTVWIDSSGEICVNHINRESPGRMFVSELMILGNWLMARFLADRCVPSIYRSQPGPKERLNKNDEGTLFQNYMQRKLLSRFALGPTPEPHSGLGLKVYTTATSPIRKYFDLVTQRQIRAVLGLESLYTAEEIQGIIHMLEQPMGQVMRLQYSRHRYWILKYLEKRIGQKEEAIVLYRRKNSYLVVIPAYMIECDLPLPEGYDLSPEDLIQVTIQHVNARKDILSVFMG